LKIRAERSLPLLTWDASGDTGYTEKTSYMKGFIVGYRLRQRDEKKEINEKE